jgi:GNAT superfamily N-acetyltransferase
MDVSLLSKRYPTEIVLEDGTKVTIRPLEREDKVPLIQFFQRIPEDDRFYLKENVTAPEVIHQWTEHMDLERAIPLIAVIGGKIVADATLHRSRAPARRHVGELRIVVDPDYRGRGLGARLIQELIDLGMALGLHRLFFELVDRRERAAIHAVVHAGFQEVAVLRDRVKDIYGSLQDLVILELPLDDKEVLSRLF